jgi:hypothetical protein
MLTALLALFVLITVACELHDGNAALERHKQFKHWDDWHSKPLVAPFIRRYTAVYGLGTSHLSNPRSASLLRRAMLRRASSRGLARRSLRLSLASHVFIFGARRLAEVKRGEMSASAAEAAIRCTADAEAL